MSNIPKHLEDAFFAGKRTDEVRFAINDPVKFSAGPNKGKGGAVISIVSMNPEVSLTIELSDGTDVVAPISEICLDEGP